MAKIAVVIPCYKSRDQVLDVLSAVPDVVNTIYCVDDACPDKTGEHIQQNSSDKRAHVLTHEKNQGVGGAMVTGYKKALEDGMDIIVKIDSDGQMDPSIIPRYVEPILQGQADYTKGNRFYNPEFLEGMPKARIFGNAGLSFLNKFSTGYWQIFDPTNGFTAIHANVLKLLPLDKINKGYFFESDMLFRLGTLRALVMDVPQKATYGNEKSNLSVSRAIFSFACNHMQNFFKRIVYSYFVRDFHLASIEWVLGPSLLLFSVLFGTGQWISSVQSASEASAGTVMLAALPLIVGLQLTLSALHFDIQNQPKTPLHLLVKQMS
ncbi:MAG: hypothetical protein DHS20C02_12780 [Micavibrio sp.]|nr:MAG: hypothetical protein DHS20C02_12780 [Micavibrio sp.]